MGLFDFFSGKKPEEFEKKGDDFYARQSFGYAKIEYEKARDRHLKKPSDDPEFGIRIHGKIEGACNGLARAHKDKAIEYIGVDCMGDALELIDLALELARDKGLREEIMGLKSSVNSEGDKGIVKPEEGDADLHSSGDKSMVKPQEGDADLYSSGDKSMVKLQEGDADLHSSADTNIIGTEKGKATLSSGAGTSPWDIEEIFFALCSAADEDIMDEYYSYGEHFIEGYVDLNQGNFNNARELLLKALGENRERVTHIQAELALCCLNLGEYDGCRTYCREYMNNFPASYRGWRIMCESFWAEGDFAEAHAFLDSLDSIDSIGPNQEPDASPVLPDTSLNRPLNRRDAPLMLQEAYVLLRGETFYLAGEYDRAKELYLGSNPGRGSEHYEHIMRALAKTLQAAGEYKEAMDVYTRLVQGCMGCGQRPDFVLRQGLAESSFAAGVRTPALVELFLGLVQEARPGPGSLYYERVGQIYEALGDQDEAQRFMAMARRTRESLEHDANGVM
ncbi:MAG: hypothetical protein HQK66_10850 [Desulfamplus sp.]|nr:hypothetical protein [Desulfamplus sp.]